MVMTGKRCGCYGRIEVLSNNRIQLGAFSGLDYWSGGLALNCCGKNNWYAFSTSCNSKTQRWLVIRYCLIGHVCAARHSNNRVMLW